MPSAIPRPRGLTQRHFPVSRSQISALPKWQGLLLVTGRPVAMVSMVPWFRRPRADEIAAAHESALLALTARANNPVGAP